MEELSIEDHPEEDLLSLQIVDATTESGDEEDVHTVYHIQVSSRGKVRITFSPSCQLLRTLVSLWFLSTVICNSVF